VLARAEAGPGWPSLLRVGVGVPFGLGVVGILSMVANASAAAQEREDPLLRRSACIDARTFRTARPSSTGPMFAPLSASPRPCESLDCQSDDQPDRRHCDEEWSDGVARRVRVVVGYPEHEDRRRGGGLRRPVAPSKSETYEGEADNRRDSQHVVVKARCDVVVVHPFHATDPEVAKPVVEPRVGESHGTGITTRISGGSQVRRGARRVRPEARFEGEILAACVRGQGSRCCAGVAQTPETRS